MLHKCANPTCTAPFRSLREGKLFISETYSADAQEVENGARRKPRREHFWLCDSCSSRFTLQFDTKLGVMTIPLDAYVAPRFLTRYEERKVAAKAAC
jgi:hypothetical protein